MKLLHSTICLLLVSFTISKSNAGSIADTLLKLLTGGGKQDVMVELSPVLEQVLMHPSLPDLSGQERSTQVASLLQEFSKSAQAPILTIINSLGLEATPFWIDNKIFLKNVELAPLQIIAAIPILFTIREAGKASIFPIETGDYQEVHRLTRQTKYQWGVAKINAPAVYNVTTGEGVVVGIIDTGAQYTHEALINSYKNDGSSWLDAVNGKSVPYDDNGHGTHVIGTIAGTTNGIGVAPGAKWIACKALASDGSAGEATLSTCGQFMACPNNSGGSCTGMPAIVSNSWGGGNDQSWYNGIISSWRAMGMIPVFAIGNSGPLCGSANSPGDQPNLISVGSTDQNDKVSSFSSRGPGGKLVFRKLYSKTTKPEVAAPGRGITSASNNNNQGYVQMSGTSMACPHVSGAAALILSANPGIGFDNLKRKLQTGLALRATNKMCPFFSPASQPNNDYGSGRIDVKRALGL